MSSKYVIEVQESFSAWFWRLKSVNGRTLAHSENYTTISHALKTVRKLKKVLKCKVFQTFAPRVYGDRRRKEMKMR